MARDALERAHPARSPAAPSTFCRLTRNSREQTERASDFRRATETGVQMIEFRLHCSHSLELDIERFLDMSNRQFKVNETIGSVRRRKRIRCSVVCLPT